MDYKKITIESYNKDAKKFSKEFKAMNSIKSHRFQKFIGLLKGGKILDLGCGSGDHSLYFKQRGLDVTSIDLSKEMVKLCNEKGLNALLMDIENLKFEDKLFDGVWAATSLLHIPKSKLGAVVKKLNSIIKPGGILYVSVKEGRGEKLVEDKSGNTKRFFVFWCGEELKSFFEKYFVLMEIKRVQIKDIVFLNAFFRKRPST